MFRTLLLIIHMLHCRVIDTRGSRKFSGGRGPRDTSMWIDKFEFSGAGRSFLTISSKENGISSKVSQFLFCIYFRKKGYMNNIKIDNWRIPLQA